MSTADVTGEGAPPPHGAAGDVSGRGPDVEETKPASRLQTPPASSVASAGWLLRSAAYVSVAAGIAGVIIGPGIRGNASEKIVDRIEGSSAALSYFLVALLVALVLWGAVELVRAQGLGWLSRLALIGSAAAVVAMSAPALRDHLPSWLSVLVAAVATVAAIAGAATAARSPHTRAVGGVLLALSFAAIARLGGWELATAAGEKGSLELYSVARGLSTAGVLFESFAQLLAVVWLGTRTRVAGRAASSVALVVACLLTWGVARGGHSGAGLVASVLHNALIDAPGLPHSYGLDAVATFLVPASLLLALVAAAQPRQMGVIVGTMALALVSRGSFDAPLRAMCAVAAGQWAALACADERIMWRALIGERDSRNSEQGLHGSTPSR